MSEQPARKRLPAHSRTGGAQELKKTALTKYVEIFRIEMFGVVEFFACCAYARPFVANSFQAVLKESCGAPGTLKPANDSAIDGSENEEDNQCRKQPPC